MELLFKRDIEKNAAICCGISDKNYDGEVVIPEVYNGATVTSVGLSAFSSSAVSKVYIPATVKVIGMQAFAYCSNLNSVTFAEDSCLETVEPMAFSCCSSLKKLRFPDGLKVLEQMAVSNCVCEIPDRCRVSFPNLDGCKVDTYEPNLSPLNPIEEDAKGNRYRLNEARDGYILVSIRAENTEVNVPEAFNGLPVVELGDRAFSQNTEAHRAIIPASVKKAGDFPFYACDEMMRAEYGGTMEEWKKMNIYTWFSVVCSDGRIAAY